MKKLTAILLLTLLSVGCLFAACSSDDEVKLAEGFACTPYHGSTSTGGTSTLPTSLPAQASEPTLQLHYHRKNAADYDKWGFWIWVNGQEGVLYNLNYQDQFGGVALYPLSAFGTDALGNGIGIIPRLQSEWTKDGDADRMFSFSDVTLGADNYYHVYIVQGDLTLYTTLDDTLQAKVNDLPYTGEAHFYGTNKIIVNTSAPITHLKILVGSTILAETDLPETVNVSYVLPSDHKLDLVNGYYFEVTYADSVVKKSAVTVTSLYGTSAFNDLYYYDGELGAIYTAQSTTFRVWSPVSTKITLNLYKQGHGTDAPTLTQDMTKGDKGVFQTTLNGDYAAMYYTYTVYNPTYPNGQEIVDPYAKSAGLSGKRGQIVDFAATNPDGWDKVTPHAYSAQELVVWETHVADVTSSSTWTGTEANRSKYLGLIEEDTIYTAPGGQMVSTGFDHIKELGVNAVQFVPVFDQANDEAAMTFNWGYNPLNYNVLEGGYSSDPTDGYVRVNEFKQVVSAFNCEGINVIMDVVYNHVNAAAGSNFDVLMPGYYFRYDSNGKLSNGSGCGNETASDHSMFRKFMIDSVCFLAKEYKLGGFRFDLMGLHDVDTMNLLKAELVKINPNIVVYGEPWEGGSTTLPGSLQADQANGSILNVGQFNDKFRDALIKGGLSGKTELGWLTNDKSVSAADVNDLILGLCGSVQASGVTDPAKVVNYVTCHDNYTLYDRIIATGAFSATDDADKIAQMVVLAEAMVMTSNGTSFMLAGDEFMRTKGGNSNSYDASYEVNELDYSLKVAHYNDVFTKVKTLVDFKRTLGAAKFTAETLAENYKVTQLAGGAAIQIDVTCGGRTYRIVHANGALAANTLSVDFSGYRAGFDTLQSGDKLTLPQYISPYQTVMAFK